MQLIADILMTAGAFAAGLYCFVLARRLRRFTDLEKGVGGAIAVLSAQVDDMTKMLTQAQKTAAGSAANLESLTARSEAVAKRLELLIASMHDLPEPDVAPPKPKSTASAESEDTDGFETLFLSQRRRVEAAE